jgi:hypothetical protein
VVSAAPRPLYPWKGRPVLIIEAAGWSSGTVGAGPVYSASIGVRTTDLPSQ